MRLPLMILGCAAALSAAAHDSDAQYAISAPGTTLTGFVTGTTLAVSVTAPTGKHAERITLKLNGKDVTSALHPDASGALTGTVSGLTPGANTLQLFAKKDEVATLTVMKAMAPAVSCDSLANLANFPIQRARRNRRIPEPANTAQPGFPERGAAFDLCGCPESALGCSPCRVTHRHGRKVGILATAFLQVSGAEILHEHTKRPAVGDRVVNGEYENVIIETTAE